MKEIKIKIGERVQNLMKIEKNENFQVKLTIEEGEVIEEILIIGSKFGYGIFENSAILKSKDYFQLKLF
ncbi:MAG TPA: hypothetical protein PLG90_10160 [Ignavibacteria bacterium]|nr:hypothetical protein [Ignavibacteria bacterium]